MKILFILYNTNNILYYNFIMQLIIQYQYSLAEKLLDFIQSINFPGIWLLLENYALNQIIGVVYVTVFIISILSWVLWRIFCRLFKTKLYNIEKYNIVLLLNFFYIVPFAYWFFWGKFNFMNVFFIFIWSWFYIWLNTFLTQPNTVIDFFN